MTSTTTGWRLDAERFLPDDAFAGTLVGRVWLPETPVSPAGPAVVALRADGVADLSERFPTMSTLLDSPLPAQAVRAIDGTDAPRVCTLDELLDNSVPDGRDAGRPFLLAPCDLQVIKACGVTFASSMLERVIEEQARGDPSQARALRSQVLELVGENLAGIKPGSPKAARTEGAAAAEGPVVAVPRSRHRTRRRGLHQGARLCRRSAPAKRSVSAPIHRGTTPNPRSCCRQQWPRRGRRRNPGQRREPARYRGPGSALLLGKAKDNNASCAIGPFIRLFDDGFGIDDVRERDRGPACRRATEGFELRGLNIMTRDQPRSAGPGPAGGGGRTSIPTASCCSSGRCSRPIEDRDQRVAASPTSSATGSRFAAPRLGCLQNRVTHSETAPPWRFGVRALINHLAARRLLGQPL